MYRLLILSFLLLHVLSKRPATHPHSGKLVPYAAGPFGMELSGDDEKKLGKGEAGED